MRPLPRLAGNELSDKVLPSDTKCLHFGVLSRRRMGFTPPASAASAPWCKIRGTWSLTAAIRAFVSCLYALRTNAASVLLAKLINECRCFQSLVFAKCRSVIAFGASLSAAQNCHLGWEISSWQSERPQPQVHEWTAWLPPRGMEQHT